MLKLSLFAASDTKELRHYLSILGVDVRDARMLFRVLDDGNGTLSVQEFCDGIAKVKGGATSADIVHLLRETGKMRKDCQACRALRLRVQGFRV